MVPAVDKVPDVAIVPTVEGNPAVEGIAADVGVRDVHVIWRPLRVTYVFAAAGIHGVPVVVYCILLCRFPGGADVVGTAENIRVVASDC